MTRIRFAPRGKRIEWHVGDCAVLLSPDTSGHFALHLLEAANVGSGGIPELRDAAGTFAELVNGPTEAVEKELRAAGLALVVAADDIYLAYPGNMLRLERQTAIDIAGAAFELLTNMEGQRERQAVVALTN